MVCTIICLILVGLFLRKLGWLLKLLENVPWGSCLRETDAELCGSRELSLESNPEEALVLGN